MPPKKRLKGEDGEAVDQDEMAEDVAMMDGATAQLAATPKSGGLAHFATGFVEGSASEMEEDAKEDARKQLSVQACFQAPDTTLNVMVGTTGNILMTLNEGGLHYFYAGARANVGIRAGRYMFEVRVIELLNQTETGMQLRMPGPKHFLRMGFSTSRCSPIMGDTEDSICFDSSGSLLFNRRQVPVTGKFLQDCTLAVVLNLDPDSPNNNTLSLFKDGRRQAPPQHLPENLQGKVLFPTLTYKNMSVHANFGPAAYVPLPFKCRTLQQAAVEDVEVVTYPASNGKYEVLFPVGLPGEGVFDWADWFLQRNPHYAEISERMVAEWATRSGIFRQKVPGIEGSNDRPEMNFGMPHLDDGTVKQILQSAAAAQQRDILFLEVRNNLLRDERLQALRRFRLPHFKKVAKVLVGQPNDDYLQHLHEELLKEKQEKVFAEFQQKRQEHAELKLLEMQKKQVEWARQKAELAQQAEAGGDADAATEEVALGEEPKMEEDTEEHPPTVELTEEEKKCCFKKPKPDATPDLMPSALSSSFASFTIPGDDEGFDEVDLSWQPREAVEDYVRRWVQEHKITTRIDDLQPSEWFREKWQRWRDDLQRWHVLHIEFKDPVKRAALMAAKAKEEKELAQKVEDKEQKEEKQADQNGSKDVDMPEQKEEAKNGEQDKEQKDAEMPAEQKEETKNGEQGATPEEKDVDMKETGAEAKMDTGEEQKSESKEMETAKEKKVEEEEEENVDYLKELEAELEQAENDVFEIEDITDIGTGEPLFCNFGFEDWALLSLRFELHLLAHAFLHDCGDPERSGIYPDHLLFYYNKYYKKGLQPKNYGVETVEDLAGLVNDTVVICPPKVLESTLAPEQEGNDIFVKLTEEARRERLRRLDAGDESARLKFATGSNSNAVKASSKAPIVIPSKAVGPVITGKAEPAMPQALLQQQQRQQAARQQMQMPGAMPGAMPGGMPGGMPGAMPGGMPGGVPGAMPGGMQRPWMQQQQQQQQGYGVPGVPLAQQRAMMARGGFGW